MSGAFRAGPETPYFPRPSPKTELFFRIVRIIIQRSAIRRIFRKKRGVYYESVRRTVTTGRAGHVPLRNAPNGRFPQREFFRHAQSRYGTGHKQSREGVLFGNARHGPDSVLHRDYRHYCRTCRRGYPHPAPVAGDYRRGQRRHHRHRANHPPIGPRRLRRGVVVTPPATVRPRPSR